MALTPTQIEAMKKLKANGMSVAGIARIFKVARFTVYYYTVPGVKEKHRDRLRNNYTGVTKTGEPMKYIKGKKRPRPDKCELCGKVPTRLNYRHWDDNNMMLGIWLCRRCLIVANYDDKGLVRKYRSLKEIILFENSE